MFYSHEGGHGIFVMPNIYLLVEGGHLHLILLIHGTRENWYQLPLSSSSFQIGHHNSTMLIVQLSNGFGSKTQNHRMKGASTGRICAALKVYLQIHLSIQYLHLDTFRKLCLVSVFRYIWKYLCSAWTISQYRCDVGYITSLTCKHLCKLR